LDVGLLRRCASEGLTRKEIADRMGKSYSRVTTVLRDQGILLPRKKQIQPKRGPKEQTLRIIELRQQGMKQKEIAETLGCCLDTVKCACKNNGLGIKQTPLTEQDAAIVISKAGYDYVSGFFNARSKVVIKCRECGCTFDKMYKYLHAKANGTYQNEMTCPHCWRKEIEEAKKKKREPKEREARTKAEQRERKKADLISRQMEARLAIHVCKNCGIEYSIGTTGYNSEKYCSEKCMKRWTMRIKNDRRIRKMRTRRHDADITLEKLFSRDAGVCYLCGGRCDWTDMVDGNAGDTYPSIDHVVPLAKGGTHTWDNIKLACRRCNWEKRDDISPR